MKNAPTCGVRSNAGGRFEAKERGHESRSRSSELARFTTRLEHECTHSKRPQTILPPFQRGSRPRRAEQAAGL